MSYLQGFGSAMAPLNDSGKPLVVATYSDAASAGAGAGSLEGVLVVGGVAAVGFLVYRHFKKKRGG